MLLGRRRGWVELVAGCGSTGGLLLTLRRFSTTFGGLIHVDLVCGHVVHWRWRSNSSLGARSRAASVLRRRRDLRTLLLGRGSAIAGLYDLRDRIKQTRANIDAFLGRAAGAERAYRYCGRDMAGPHDRELGSGFGEARKALGLRGVAGFGVATSVVRAVADVLADGVRQFDDLVAGPLDPSRIAARHRQEGSRLVAPTLERLEERAARCAPGEV